MESQKGPSPLLQIKTNTLYYTHLIHNWSTNWRKMIVYRNYRSNFLFVCGFHCNLLLRSLVGCISSSSSSSRACCIKTKVPTFRICHWLGLKSTFFNSSFQSVSTEPKVGDPPWKMQRLQWWCIAHNMHPFEDCYFKNNFQYLRGLWHHYQLLAYLRTSVCR